MLCQAQDSLLFCLLSMRVSAVWDPHLLGAGEVCCSQDDPGSFLNQVITLLAAKVTGAWVSGLGSAH